MLAVINEPEPERHIELSHRERIEIVHRHAPIFDIDFQQLSHELRLSNQISLRVDAQHARRAATLHLDRIEASVAADIKNGLAAEVFWQSSLNKLPGRRRMVD